VLQGAAAGAMVGAAEAGVEAVGVEKQSTKGGNDSNEE